MAALGRQLRFETVDLNGSSSRNKPLHYL